MFQRNSDCIQFTVSLDDQRKRFESLN